MIELTVECRAEDVLQECLGRGMVVKLEGTVKKHPGGRHWHLGFLRRAGVLEMTELGGQVSLKVADNRDGGWATELAQELARSKNAAQHS